LHNGTGKGRPAPRAVKRDEIDNMADWYYTKDGKQQGPVSSAQLRQLAQAGELQPTDMVFKEGASQWVAASTIANLFGSSGGVASKPSAPERPGREDRDDRNEGSLAFDSPGDDDDDGGPIRRKPKTGGGGGFVDFLMFRRMIAPWIIMAIFWLGTILITLGHLFSAGTTVIASRGAIGGILFALFVLVAIPFVILVLRLYCEVMILLFRMNETLTDIREALKKQGRDKS
jgi:hypothetical protein